tara:strand:- start:106 stop:324 length:219 start_codon:yes stop_codon:yes gene_type:complete
MILETVIALLMFVNGEIKEHRIQESMSKCLKGKRIAERVYQENVQYQCIKSEAELETNIDGSLSIKKLIIKE